MPPMLWPSAAPARCELAAPRLECVPRRCRCCCWRLRRAAVDGALEQEQNWDQAVQRAWARPAADAVGAGAEASCSALRACRCCCRPSSCAFALHLRRYASARSAARASGDWPAGTRVAAAHMQVFALSLQPASRPHQARPACSVATSSGAAGRKGGRSTTVRAQATAAQVQPKLGACMEERPHRVGDCVVCVCLTLRCKETL